MTSSRLERCAGSLRPAWAAFGRLGVAASLIALGATSPAPHAFATTPALNHASMARTGATIAVVNSLASTVTAYGASASGDARPIATLTLGLDIPDCATFDAAGDLWVVNFNGRSVVEYASNAFSGGPQAPERTISSDSSGSLNSPAGCTFDHSGDLWVANDLTNTVVEYAPGTPASGAQVPIATISSDGSDSLSGPVALAFDPSGDLWVANYDNSTVVEYTVSDLASGSQVPAVTISADASGVLNSPLGIAFDRSGDLWVAANLSDKLLEYARSGLAGGPEAPAVTISADSSGSLNSPGGLAFDPSGDLWVANYGDDSLAEFAPAQLAVSGTLATSAVAGPSTGLSTPLYVAVDPAAGRPTASGPGCPGFAGGASNESWPGTGPDTVREGTVLGFHRRS